MTDYIIFHAKPQDFDTSYEVAACYCEFKGKILFLFNNPNKPYGATWSIPGGKLEEGEKAVDGVIREIWEETKISLKKNEVTYLTTVYVRYPTFDFVYHMFATQLDNLPEEVVLNAKEHEAFQWMTLEEAFSKPLIPGEKECIIYAQCQQFFPILHNGL